MGKYKKSLFAFIFFSIMVTNFLLVKSKDSINNSILLQNVEALAAGEDEGIGDYGCYGEGTVDCPNRKKVEIYINNLRLDLE